jgi:hypothetical protein
MSKVDDRINELATAAVDIAIIKDPAKRHRGGFWLESELDDLWSKHLFTQEQRYEFMAVIKILFDVIWRDAVEESADLAPMEVGKSELTKLIQIAESEATEVDRKAWEEG